jgi:hypothetical protein
MAMDTNWPDIRQVKSGTGRILKVAGLFNAKGKGPVISVSNHDPGLKKS